MHTCSKCKETKPLAGFYVLGSGPRAGRIQSYCRACQSQQRRDAYYRNRSDADAYARVLEQNRAWRAANPGKMSRHARKQWLKRRYGMTIEQYDKLLEEQGGVCSACGGLDQNGHRLAVDHCHDTGKIRGLLCDFCNRALGLLRNDPRIAHALGDYLERC